MPGTVLGVDFGTSNTAAVLATPTALGGTELRVVAFDGQRLMPSSIYFADDGSLATGREAERLARLAPERFEPNPKRRIDDVELLLGADVVGVQRAITAVLARVRSAAAAMLDGRPPVRLHLTHPAQWGRRRRGVLRAAAADAGWSDPDEVVLIPEPIAAATNFRALPGQELPEGHAVAVYDLGGGTFDAAVVQSTGDGLTVLAEGGLSDVGGVDFDQLIWERIGRDIAANDRGYWQAMAVPQTAADRRASRSLREDVRAGKERLSRAAQTEIPLPDPFSDLLLTRGELENLIRPALNRTVSSLRRTVAESGAEVSAIYLVGGSSRIPLVASMIAERTSLVPVSNEDPELAVAYGAAMVQAVTVQAGGAVVGHDGAGSAPSPFAPETAVPITAVPGGAGGGSPGGVGAAGLIDAVPDFRSTQQPAGPRPQQSQQPQQPEPPEQPEPSERGAPGETPAPVFRPSSSEPVAAVPASAVPSSAVPASAVPPGVVPAPPASPRPVSSGPARPALPGTGARPAPPPPAAGGLPPIEPVPSPPGRSAALPWESPRPLGPPAGSAGVAARGGARLGDAERGGRGSGRPSSWPGSAGVPPVGPRSPFAPSDPGPAAPRAGDAAGAEPLEQARAQLAQLFGQSAPAPSSTGHGTDGTDGTGATLGSGGTDGSVGTVSTDETDRRARTAKRAQWIAVVVALTLLLAAALAIVLLPPRVPGQPQPAGQQPVGQSQPEQSRTGGQAPSPGQSGPVGAGTRAPSTPTS